MDSYNQISETQEFESLKDNYLPKSNILIFIYFYIVLIGFFFSITINFKNDSDRVSNILIGGFILVHSLFIMEFGIYSSNLRYIYPHSYLMSSSIALLYGPLLYFYFKRINIQYQFKLKDTLHLIPSIIILILLFPFYSLSSVEKLKVMFGISALYSTKDFFYIVFIPKLFSYTIYGFLIGKLYFKKENKLSNIKGSILTKWKRNIYYMHILYVLAYLIYGISIAGILFTRSEVIYHSQVLFMSLMVLYIAQMAYLNPIVFDYKSFKSNNGLGFSKYLKSGLTESLSEELRADLIKLFTDEKVYQDSNLNLDILSEKLNTTRHNTSQIINEHFDMNFFELINKFRIDEALNLLEEDKNGNLNIIDIAYEIGYNNKVTFNKAFKKATALTPSQYIDSLKNQSERKTVKLVREW